MTTISTTTTRSTMGPVSKDGLIILNSLAEDDSTEMRSLREKTTFIRSRFWKTVMDLKSLGLLKFNR